MASKPSPLNLLKLCVGADDIQDLAQWQHYWVSERKRLKRSPEIFHTTRMVPKRADEIVTGGSLYWVIKGQVQVRQLITEIRPFKDDEGIRRCHLVLHPDLVLTQFQPRRPFQGWRYLEAKDAPKDLPSDLQGDAQSSGAIPEEMRQDLMELGLL